MNSYTAYKNRIEGFKDVAETVKMVEKISASSVHLLEQKVSSLNNYTTEIEKILSKLYSSNQTENHPLLKIKSKGKKVLIVLTGNKGLVGGLWHKIITAFSENNNHQEIILFGTKEEKILKKRETPIIKLFSFSSDIPQKEDIKEITDYVFNKFRKGLFSEVEVLYPQFISLGEQKPNIISFLPFEFNLIEKEEEGLPIFEPSKQTIFNKLLQKYIGTFFYKIVMETKLSELSARVVTMEHAFRKTKEFIQKFSLNYLKERRRDITQSQLESFAIHKRK